jgi:choline-sulfatase
MKFRGLIVAGSVLAAAAVAWFGWRLVRTPPSFAGPVIVVSIDTLRADHLPLDGYTGVETPAIDALAADGVVFEQAWAHAPQTLPSHASMLTGLLPFEHGVRDNMGFALKPGTPTAASRLRAMGFATGGFVSAYVLRADTGIAQGFDTFDDKLPPASPEVEIGEVQRDGADTVSAATRWLATLTSPRFFLFLHLYEPHTPYSPPERFRRFKPYDGEIAYADELLGRLVASLKDRHLYDEALIVVVSDHGEGLGDHGEMEHGLFLYRETTRVPLVVKLPARRRAGLRVSAPVQLIDLVPTLLDAVKAPHDAALRGRSVFPLFDGGTIPEQGLYAEALYPRYHFGWSEIYALTDARFRFIRAPRDELYDISLDPGERQNLAASRESTGAAMRQALDRLMAGTTVAAPAEVSAEARERLKALGYIGTSAPVDGTTGFGVLPDPKDKIGVLEQYRSGLALVRSGRTREAVAVLRGIVAANPKMADVWNEIAGLLVRQGRLEEALDAYKREVEASPHDPAGIVSVAQIYLELGKLDSAREQAELALTLLPATDKRWRASARKMLMRAALGRHDTAEALRQARLGQEEDPSMPLVAFTEGLVRYEAGRYESALPFFQNAVKQVDGRPFAVPELRYYLGDTLGRLDRYAEAEPHLVEEIRLFPSSLRARAALAMLYRAQGRIADSDRLVDGLVKFAPTPQGFGLAAQLWTMFGEPGRAASAKAQAAATASAR